MARQRQHLVNGNTGSDYGVTHRSFADLALNVCSTNFGNIRCLTGETLFTLCYLLTLTARDQKGGAHQKARPWSVRRMGVTTP